MLDTDIGGDIGGGSDDVRRHDVARVLEGTLPLSRSGLWVAPGEPAGAATRR